MIWMLYPTPLTKSRIDLERLAQSWHSLQSLLETYMAMVGSLPVRVPNGILLEYSAYSGFLTSEPLDNLSD